MDRLDDLRPGRQGEVVLRPTRRGQVFLFLLSASFVAGGIWMVSEGRADGWIVAGIFASGLVVPILQVLPGASFLRLAPEGFTMRTMFRSTTLCWEDVGEFVVVRLKQHGVFTVHTMIGFDFAPGYDRSLRARALARAISGCEGALPDTYGLKPEELATLMNEWRERYSTGPQA